MIGALEKIKNKERKKPEISLENEASKNEACAIYFPIFFVSLFFFCSFLAERADFPRKKFRVRDCSAEARSAGREPGPALLPLHEPSKSSHLAASETHLSNSNSHRMAGHSKGSKRDTHSSKKKKKKKKKKTGKQKTEKGTNL